ncbi:10490_t:CDS:2, partial [Rhizophagus irregularis]
MDKCNILFYFFISGPNARKLRNSTELHWMASFNTSFENSFNLRSSETDPFLAVNLRMLCQLFNKKLNSIIEKYDLPHLLKVLELVFKFENRKLNDIAV